MKAVGQNNRVCKRVRGSIVLKSVKRTLCLCGNAPSATAAGLQLTLLPDLECLFASRPAFSSVDRRYSAYARVSLLLDPVLIRPAFLSARDSPPPHGFPRAPLSSAHGTLLLYIRSLTIQVFILSWFLPTFLLCALLWCLPALLPAASKLAF